MRVSECPKYLYIHWPFCASKCSYCDFVSFAKHDGFERAYHDALCNEIRHFARTCTGPIQTIFLGGGTPSLYPLELLRDLFKTIHDCFNTSNLHEVTIETNPRDITKERLTVWRDVGINRLSMGVQVLDDQVLQILNRPQTTQCVHDAMALIPKYFENISIDLILGIPGVTPEVWQDTLDQAVCWPIKHVSVYMLTIYEKTPLFFKIAGGEIDEPDNDELAQMYEQTVDFLEKQGFEQYEISNFAKPGYKSIHNQAYWDRKSYMGFGLSAASFDGKRRMLNTKNLGKYLTFWQNGDPEGDSVPQTKEIIDEKSAILEELMLGLRQKKGVGLHRMVYLLKNRHIDLLDQKVSCLKKQKLVEEKSGKIFLTRRGMIVENEVVLSLFSVFDS